MKSALKYFAGLTDPRVEWTKEYLLEEILFMTIAAVLRGAEAATILPTTATPSGIGWDDFSPCRAASRRMTPSIGYSRRRSCSKRSASRRKWNSGCQ